DLFLEQDRAGVDAGVDPEDGEAGALLAVDDRPVHGAAPAVAGQERGVVLDGLPGRGGEGRLGGNSGDEGEDVQGGGVSLEALVDLGRAVAARLLEGEAQLAGAPGQGVWSLGRVRRGVDDRERVAGLLERVEDILSEWGLAEQGDAHAALRGCAAGRG